MPRYEVTLRGTCSVEGVVNIVADTGQQAIKLAQALVDDVVAQSINWELDSDQPVRDVRPVDAIELD